MVERGLVGEADAVRGERGGGGLRVVGLQLGEGFVALAVERVHAHIQRGGLGDAAPEGEDLLIGELFFQLGDKPFGQFGGGVQAA